MGFYSEEIIAEVQSTADIIEVISQYTSLQKRGNNYMGLCPFHSEKTPSFNVDYEKQLFYCFGCGAGGNVFNFLMKKENLSFPEAVRWLADKYNIKLPENKLDKAVSQEFKERRKLYQINELIAKYYNYCMFNTREGKRAIEYLKKRGVTLDTIKRFFLGYAPNSWNGLINFSASQGINLDHMEKLGLIVPRKKSSGYYDRFRNRIMFPIQDITKNIIGFGGRAIDDSVPKYLNSPETPLFSKGDNLYALSLAKRDFNGYIIIVEGYMDCISLHQHGFNQTVASLGTALTKQQAKLLKKYTDKVILAYDADEAGQVATLRGMDILEKEGLNVRILSLPKGEDPDDYIRSKGAEGFHKLLEKSLELTGYKLHQAKGGIDISTANGKITYIKRAIDILTQIKSEPQLEIYIKKVANDLKISEQAIKQEVRRKKLPNNGFEYKKSQSRDNNKEFNKLLPLTGFYKAEINLLKLLIDSKEFQGKIRSNMRPEHFTNKDTRKIADVLFDRMDKGVDIKVSEIFNLLDEESSSQLSRVLMIDLNIQNESMVDSLMQKVKEGYYKKSIRQVREQIKRAELLGQREEIINLLSMYQKLKTEMEHLNIHYTPGKGGA